MKDSKKYIFSLVLIGCACLAFFLATLHPIFSQESKIKETYASTASSTLADDGRTKTARLMVAGELLYHDILYLSALQADDTYDFSNNFIYVKPWLDQADLSIVDFEGTINSEVALSGNQLFNAPKEVAKSLQDAGFDVINLASSHILDTGLEGLALTHKAFTDLGLTTVGGYPNGNHSTADLTIRNVNGIHIAILAYASSLNGQENLLTDTQSAAYLSMLDEQTLKTELARAESQADFTIVLPRMGTEYALKVDKKQKTLYQNMVKWGADLVLGGGTHTPQPAEVVEQDGSDKLIVYSLGNFLSNQRIETMVGVENAEWTERGLLMDITLEKSGGVTTIRTAQGHPTWVSRVENGYYSPAGYPLYDFKTFVIEDFLEGTEYRDWIDAETQDRIDTAYDQVNDLIKLTWDRK